VERIRTAFTGVLAVFLAVGIISFNIVYAHKPLKTRESNKQINFRPSLALIGYNLSANIENSYSENSIQKYYASGNNALPFSFPQSVEAIFADYTGIISSTEFYEPFTQT
jgi:multisubunit Na+/H+ antiporter MnhB subunit